MGIIKVPDDEQQVIVLVGDYTHYRCQLPEGGVGHTT